MDAPQSPPTPAAHAPAPPAVVAAWPRPAQRAAALLLGLATAFLAVHTYGCSRWATRPADLERGAVLAYQVDLNRADRAELLQLPGVGDSLAGRIEDYRREHGPFRSVDDLRLVRGVGPATLERLRDWVCVGSEGEEDIQPLALASPPTGKKPPPRKDQAAGRGKKEASLTGPIDINRASAEELQRLPGIGPKLSQRIVDERRRRPFGSVNDLQRVSGIKGKTVERLRPFVTVTKNAEDLADLN